MPSNASVCYFISKNRKEKPANTYVFIDLHSNACRGGVYSNEKFCYLNIRRKYARQLNIGGGDRAFDSLCLN